MTRTSIGAAILQRRKLWVKVLTILLLAALYYLQPRVQTWLDARNGKDAGSAEQRDAGVVVSNRQNENLGPVVILDSGELPVAEVDPSSRIETPDEENSGRETPGTQQNGGIGQPPLGKLREIRNNVFESTAGLQYVPGSADSHRLKHVMQHAKDDTSKPIHGVFEGDRDQILAAIDEAFEMAVNGGRDVRSEKQNDRLVYTVNMGRAIGYVGGFEGKRQGNPECRYLRIVLEDKNIVISAYPTKSF